MNEVQLTDEDRKVLIEANELYHFDWRENDDDQATAGWRHPGYFQEVGKPYDFEKLVSMGLMEKGGNPDYVTYRISELGMAKIDKLVPPAVSEPVHAGEGVFAMIERRIMKSGDARFLEGINEPIGLETARYINDQSIALRNTQKSEMSFYEMYQDATTENAALGDQLAAAERERKSLTGERDHYLERQNKLLRTALGFIVTLGDGYLDEAGKVGINFTLATILKSAREALKASVSPPPIAPPGE